jgi:hypothetical protein
MKKIKVGDKIVCINEIGKLKKYKIYIIEDLVHDFDQENQHIVIDTGVYQSFRFISLSEYRKIKIKQIIDHV